MIALISSIRVTRSLSTFTQTPQTAQARLVGDIGGTNARFAIADVRDRLSHVRALRCADFAGPEDALRHYFELEAIAPPPVAAFGIANPVTGDEVAMTNHRWRFSVERLREHLGLDRLLLVNDFTALALSVPRLGPDDLHAVGGGTPVAGQAIGLIGPGTGLGVSGLVPTADGYLPLQGEGGHVTLAARDAREARIIEWMWRHHDHVSAERLLSGPGLVMLHDAVRDLADAPTCELGSADITARALARTCPYCAEALDLFCAMLGTVAGDLALTLGARGGVYLGGGILPRLGPSFAQSRFRSRFEDKGRFSSYLSRIPTFVIDAPYAALRGAAAALKCPVRVGYDTTKQAQ